MTNAGKSIACLSILAIGLGIAFMRSRPPIPQAEVKPPNSRPPEAQQHAIGSSPAPPPRAQPIRPLPPRNGDSPERQIGSASSEQERLDILKLWVIEDSDKAFAWLCSIQSKFGLTRHHKVFFTTLLHAHPGRLGDFLEQVREIAASYPTAASTAEARSRLDVRNIIAVLLESTEGSEIHPAVLAVPSLFQSDLGISIEYAIARDWSTKTDRPDQIIAWLTESDRSLLERKSTFRMVLDHWTRRSPIEAAAWAASAIDKDLLPPETMDSIMFRWGQMDAASAFEWLDLTTRGETTPPWVDPAISSLVLGIAGESPAVAIRWTNEIEDENARKKTLAALPKWTWDNKSAWDAAVLAYLKQPTIQPEASTPPNRWLETIHSESVKLQATGHLQNRRVP